MRADDALEAACASEDEEREDDPEEAVFVGFTRPEEAQVTKEPLQAQGETDTDDRVCERCRRWNLSCVFILFDVTLFKLRPSDPRAVK